MPSFPVPSRTRLRRAASALFAPSREPVYLVSAGGQPNFGDEFITRSWLDWLAENQPEREVWLDTIEPGRAAHLFHDTHPRLRTTNTLWHLAHTGPREIEPAEARVRNLIHELGTPRYDLGLRDLRRMESIHLLGGGYINEIWPENFGIIAAMTTLRADFGVRIFATGQGFMPVSGGIRDRLAAHLADFDHVDARDASSAEALGVELGTDDAFLSFANQRELYAPADDLPDAMVLIQGDMFEGEGEPALRTLVSDFVGRRSQRTVGFAEAIPPDDVRYAEPFVADGAPFYPFIRMWDDGFPAKPGQEWLTSRFHFHLLAAAAGATGSVVNARQGYYDVKHGLLTELGTGWSVHDAVEGAFETTPTGDPQFGATARRLGESRAALAARLYASTP
ncbi:polysaccharide pyruvyl transferase family protein [Microbacterium sp. 1.5R]|uniref:polysaccharide pyruvyl transferase family protein n=1 Tax=Microbacterium sp. 1.5R TaxID=1916917 RepID=UPI0011A0F7A2|nr:polysaccharide pyruvyl transferase family protein [Microbacterium sp. 1.5R]